MRTILLSMLCFCYSCCFCQNSSSSPNIFIITTDGCRWQELFTGADSVIINDPKYVQDTFLAKQIFWHADVLERRKLLMPFVWNVIEREGSIYGNRYYDSKVSVNNPYRFSYAGYNEIFTGYADPAVITNKKRWNSNENILQYLNHQPAYKNKVAAFASWNLFDYIFNTQKKNFYLNSGYQLVTHDSLTQTEELLNGIQQLVMDTLMHTRNDMLTFVAAKEYIQKKHPKVVYIGFGETDEYAHAGAYDMYLQSARAFDQYLAQLWYLVNSDPFYKNNTNFIITTDHGRGKKPSTWHKHGTFTKGSKQTWMITMGPAFSKNGEVKAGQELFNEQLAQTIAELLGEEFITDHPVADAMQLYK